MVAPKMPKKLIFLSVFFLSLPLLGHHNYRLRFDDAQEVSMEGTVASFEWKNPHLEISLDVENDQGKTENWILPTAAPRVAQNNGLGPETVVVGDEIIVLGIEQPELYLPKIEGKTVGVVANPRHKMVVYGGVGVESDSA